MTSEATISSTFDLDLADCDGTTRRILAEEAFLRRVAERLARQSADVDDLVQETMLRAFKARRRFVAGTSIRAWLKTILRRLFLTSVRTERRRATRTNSDSIDSITIDGDAALAPAPWEQSDRPILRLDRVDDDVKRAFERLPSEHRELFMLALLEGFSYREIATRLHMPVGTVMSRLHRARLRIQSAVGDRKIA